MSEVNECAADDDGASLLALQARFEQLRELQKAIEAVLTATDRMNLGRVAIHIDHANQVLAREIGKLEEAL